MTWRDLEPQTAFGERLQFPLDMLDPSTTYEAEFDRSADFDSPDKVRVEFTTLETPPPVTLSSVTLNGVEVRGWNLATTRFHTAPAVLQLGALYTGTVVATPTDERATVTISPEATQETTESAILSWEITVSSDEDSAVYTLTLPVTVDRFPDIVLASANTNPRGATSHDGTFYVADPTANRIFAYDVLAQTLDTAKSFSIPNLGNGCYTDGTTMWVTKDNNTRLLEAYVLATKARDSTKDFTVPSYEGNYPIQGFARADSGSWWTVRPRVGSQARLGGGLLLIYPPNNPIRFDRITAGARLFIDVDPHDGKMYVLSRAILGSGSLGPRGRIQPYSGTRPQSGSFDTAEANDRPYGIAFEGGELGIVDTSDRRVYTYNLDGTRLATAPSEVGNTAFTDIWRSRGTNYVLDAEDTNIYAYASGGRAVPASDIDLDRANADPSALWGDGTTVWVADNADDKFYAYTVSSKARDADKDFDYPAGVGTVKNFARDTEGNWYVSVGGAMRKYNSALDTILAEAIMPAERFSFRLLRSRGSVSEVVSYSAVGVYVSGSTLFVLREVRHSGTAIAPARYIVRLDRRSLTDLSETSSVSVALPANNASLSGLWVNDDATQFITGDDNANTIVTYDIGGTLVT